MWRALGCHWANSCSSLPTPSGWGSTTPGGCVRSSPGRPPRAAAVAQSAAARPGFNPNPPTMHCSSAPRPGGSWLLETSSSHWYMPTGLRWFRPVLCPGRGQTNHPRTSSTLCDSRSACFSLAMGEQNLDCFLSRLHKWCELPTVITLRSSSGTLAR